MSRLPRPAAALVVASLLGLGGILFFFDPASAGFYPPCLFRLATGLLCPGCGGLRATHALLHGDLGAAWRLNPLFVASLPVVAFAAAVRIFPTLRSRLQALAPRLSRGALSGLAIAVVIGFWVVRNLPAFR